MKNLQIVLNSILAKNIFEYMLIDRDFRILSSSSGIKKYLDKEPSSGDEVLEYFPEFVGNEDEIKQIFIKKYCLYSLESVYKNEYYVNISIEYCTEDTAIVLIHNITAVTLSNQRLLQYSNESSILNSTLQKVVDNQNALLFVVNSQSDKIEFVNKKFMEYFEVAEISDIEKLELNLYQKFDDSLCSYDELFNHADNSEILIKVGIDTFIMKATLVEATHKLFTMTKITELSKGLQLDPLTGIYKKEYLDEILKKFLRNKQSFPLAILDLDDFKRVNDTYGHLIGDQVLKEFVQLVKQHICKNDFFARWGGEEFMLLLEDNTIEESKEKIEKLRETIDKHPFETIGHLTSSFGLAYTTNCDDIDSIIRRADKALYEAKANGKNQIIFKS